MHSATRTALEVLGLHNLVQNFSLNERGYVVGNLVVSGVLVGIGRASGLGWHEMGLVTGDVHRGLRLGVRAAQGGAVLALMALAHPRTRVVLRDDRAAARSWGEVWRRVLIRFPIGTALFEEVAFRGVLSGLLGRTRPRWRAEAMSSAVFALWHVIPTSRALAGNPLGQGMSIRQRLQGVAVGCALAGLSGLAFAWMKRATGSLLAPWLAHSAFNSLSYLAGVTAIRTGSSR